MEDIPSKLEKGLTSLNNILNQLWGLPHWTFIAILCFVTGLFLRYQKKFPNDAIPWVVIFMGGILGALLADPRKDDWPIRTWVTKNIGFGFLVGMLVWLGHKFGLKPLARKFTWLGFLAPSEGDTVPDVPKTPEIKEELKSKVIGEIK